MKKFNPVDYIGWSEKHGLLGNKSKEDLQREALNKFFTSKSSRDADLIEQLGLDIDLEKNAPILDEEDEILLNQVLDNPELMKTNQRAADLYNLMVDEENDLIKDQNIAKRFQERFHGK